MDLLRTPDDRFDDLAGFPLAPRWVEVADPDGGAAIRVATYAAGPDDAPAVLMLHGEPTWSYLYRHVVDAVVEAGLRAVAVDMVGFGRSDKPAAIADHSYARHVAWTHRGRRGARPARRRAARSGLGRADRAAPRRRRARALRRRRRLEHRPADRRPRHARPSGGSSARPSRRRRSSTSAASSPPAACAGSPTPTARRTTPRSPTRRSRRGRGRCRCWSRPARTTRRPSATAPPGRRWAATRSRSSSPSPTPTRSPGRWARCSRGHVPGAAGREHPTITDAGHFLQEDAGAELGRVVGAFAGGLPH